MTQPNNFRPLHRCVSCGLADSQLEYCYSELCLSCFIDRVRPIEPGYRLEIALVAEGYDFPLAQEGDSHGRH